MRVSTYLKTRIPTLNPTLNPTWGPPPNPINLLSLLSGKQWLFFLVGFFAWTWDAFDFFTVTLNYTELSATFGKPIDEITLAATFTLMSRPLGAAIFGIAADRFGRKWPFVINNIFLIIFELLTGFCKSYQQFLAVRTFFGIAMGGIYGNAAATALEDCPSPAAGLLSGMYQSGYSFGYLLATAFKHALAHKNYGWRPLFWFGAGPPVLIIIFRLCLPETDTYSRRIGLRLERHGIFEDARVVMERHWLLLIYLILLMTGFSFMSHGSEDLYPNILTGYNYSSTYSTRVIVVENLGAIVGSIVVGYCSQILGRRFSIIVMCLVGGALLYPYTFVSRPGIFAAAFFEQFCIEGALGIIPIHLIELSPVPFRAFVVGTSYHLGILVASASNTIEASRAERYLLRSEVINGKSTPIYDYSIPMCILVACTFVYVIVMTILGPEKRGSLALEEDVDPIEGF